jgi:hypothetical protein
MAAIVLVLTAASAVAYRIASHHQAQPEPGADTAVGTH